MVADLQRNVETRLHGLLRHAADARTQASIETLRERLLAFETHLAAPRHRPGTRQSKRRR
jgi:hypothetical protein